MATANLMDTVRRTAADPSRALPRLAVISDVAPEETVAGNRLLYRLLRQYEPSDLMVVDADVWPSDPLRRLPGVGYHTVRYKSRYHDTRLHSLFSLWNVLAVRRHFDELRKLVEAHGAEAILTVAHGHLWLVAARIARVCGLPLHLIIHDDWPGYTSVPWGLRGVINHLFKAVYTEATSRFCISEYMEVEYRQRYGAAGTVLRPFRGPDSPEPRVRMRHRNISEPLAVAFAGSIPNAGYLSCLSDLAAVLSPLGGTLDLYTNTVPRGAAEVALARPNVRFRGFLPPSELAECLGKTADILFVPGSFASVDSTQMTTLFPSKLVEYTAIGIPILIWGPEYSAAVQWGRGSGGAAEVVTDPAPEAIAESLRRLTGDPDRARRMAETALELGNEQFSFERALTVFDQGLLQTGSRALR